MNDNHVLDNVLDPVGQPTGIFGRVSDPDRVNTGNVMDPRRQPVDNSETMKGYHMADRLNTLEGKVLYLVETGFHGAKDFMGHVADWFAKNKPGVKIISKSTRGMIFTDDPELWAEIEKEGDAVLLGVGG
jgi:hypothetical protein